MPTSRTTRRGGFLIALGIVVALGALYLLVAPAPLTVAELRIYNEHFRLRGRRPSQDQVVIVAVDEPSLRAVGRWPWPRNVLGDLVKRLDQAGVATIAFDIILNEPERSGELLAAHRLRERLGPRADDPAVKREIDAIERNADHDGQLADAIRASGRVVLATVFDLSPTLPTGPPARQGQPIKSAILSFKHYDDRGHFPPINADSIGLPIPSLLAAARSLGHVNMLADIDGTTRWEGLVIEYRGHYYPSLALETVRVAAGLEPHQARLDFGNTLDLGQLKIPIDPRARVLIDYAGPDQTFTHYSASDVLAGRVPTDRLRDRIVFIGTTAAGLYDLRVTPFTPVLAGVEKHANMAANLLEGRFIIRPGWVELVELATILIFPLVLAWLLPRLRPMTSLAVTLAVWLVLFGAIHLAFRRGLWLPTVYPSLAMGFTFVAITVFRFFSEERQRLWTKRAFERYVSPDVVERIVEDPRALVFGGEVRNLTILFCDIRDFTTYAERHEPQEVVAMLREHLTRLTAVIFDERGTLDKYIGDAVMAIFGAPAAVPDHAVRACRAALRMIDEVEQLRAKWEAEGKEPFRIGIGINTGDMVVGNLGSEQVFSYTVTGDAVNIGSRLEGLNKDYATTKPIIISEYTYEATRDAVDARPLGEVKVKGKTRPVAVYELIGLKEPVST